MTDHGPGPGPRPRTARELGIMKGFPPPPEKIPTPWNWDLAPFNRHTFLNVRSFVPTVEVRADAARSRPLPRADAAVDALTFAAHDGSVKTVAQMLAELDDWQLEDGTAIRRRFEFKGFAKAVEMANLAAWLGNRQGHHPDVTFGWGYCEVTFTTHAIGGLSENDFICAAKVDQLLV